MSFGSTSARVTATAAVFVFDKAVRVGHAAASNGNDFFSVLGEDFTAKNAVAAAKREVDFAANKAAREALRAEIAAGTAPVIAPAKKVKLARA